MKRQATAAKQIVKANDVLELLRKFHGVNTERGDALTSQAAELLRSGWDAVGYLLAAPTTMPHPESGKEAMYGAKRVATDLGEAAEMEVWFQHYRVEGYTPLCRFYLRKEKVAMRNSEFKSAVVYRSKFHGYETIVEFIPAAPDLKREEFGAIAEHIALDWFDARSAAQQLAFLASMANFGAKVMYFNSSSAVKEAPERDSTIGLRGYFGTGGYDAA